MRAKQLFFFFRYHVTRLTITPVLFLLLATGSAYGGTTDTTELLSDSCIADITAGAMGEYITAFYETPTTAFLDIEPRWWGDMDGFHTECGSRPGFFVSNMPYIDFQYDTFKYTFTNQADADAFVNDLSTLGGTPVNVIRTDYIKSNPRAKNFLSGDGAGPEINEIIITTDRKVDGFFTRDHNGRVITQDVRFDLTFLPPYLKEKHERAVPHGSILERSLTFRNDLRYEWMPSTRMRGEMVRNEDGTYSFIDPHDKSYYFGAVYLEAGRTGEDPISSCGLEVVPPDTVYQKTNIYNDVIVNSPQFGVAIGLAPQGAAITTDSIKEDQTHYPDLDRYKEIGALDIKHLTIYVSGGNDIYIYPNNEELPYLCP